MSKVALYTSCYHANHKINLGSGVLTEFDLFFQPILQSVIYKHFPFEVNIGVYCKSESIDIVQDVNIYKIPHEQFGHHKNLSDQYPDFLVSLNVPLSRLCDLDFIHFVTLHVPVKLAIEVIAIDVNPFSIELNDNISLLRKFGVQLWLSDYLCYSSKKHMAFGIIEWDMVKVDISDCLKKSKYEMIINSIFPLLTEYTRFGVILKGFENNSQHRFIFNANYYDGLFL
ncbi:hypothetical protein BIT28_04500 [Photobacterium proteolyticum]|uniref:EAL domain-containing protein n=1 Tax=Photobacterium proteolyticum TaxID=1903952 RepID=A0A1Q9H1Q0_9GAMM|nr:hypothetical protein [Photobacterium proteolyticum]OLQ81647.1 hypothetical protein BIT28_04500 [Photobacterium proteolyticum]